MSNGCDEPMCEDGNDVEMESAPTVDQVTHCEVCDVRLKNQQLAQAHYAGKKHQKLLAAHEHRQELIAKSVFINGFKSGSSVTEMEIREAFKADAGTISDIYVDRVNHKFAIVSFTDASVVDRYLALGKLNIGRHRVNLKRRTVVDRSTKSDQLNASDPDQQKRLDVPSLLSGIHDVSGQLNRLMQHTLTSVEDRRSIANKIQTALGDVLPGVFTVELFGSSATKLGTPSSDLDMTIIWSDDSINQMLDDCLQQETVDKKAARKANATDRSSHRLLTAEVMDLVGENAINITELAAMSGHDRIKYLTRMLNLLRRKGDLPIVDLVPIYSIRCPLVTFKWTGDDQQVRSCDMSINNRLSVNNTQWLIECCTAQPVLPRLAILLRFWCGWHDLTCTTTEQGARKATFLFSNYSLLLICVAFLQRKKLLNTVTCSASHLIDGWNCAYDKPAPQMEPLELGPLVQELYTFLAECISSTHVISCRHPEQKVMLEQYKNDCEQALVNAGHEQVKAVEMMNGFQQGGIMVADPFVLNHNTSARVASKVVMRCQRLLARTIKTIQSSDSSSTQPGLMVLFPSTVANSDQGSHPATSPTPANDMETTISPSCPDSRSWCQNLLDGQLDRVLTDIFKFVRVPGSDDDDDECMEPLPAKRQARQTVTATYEPPPLPTWVKRRSAKKQCQEAVGNRSVYDTESAITDAVLAMATQNSSAAIPSKPFTFVCQAEVVDSNVVVRLQHLEGDKHEFTTMAHFLLPYLSQHLPKMF